MGMLTRVFLLFASAFSASGQVSVLSYHNDLARTGQNLQETVLTPANVNAAQFGKRFSNAVDGYVYAQPLYVPGVAVAGRGTHNVVYVATEHDSVYAFDADADSGAPLWKTSFLSSGVTTVPTTDIGCGQIVPEIGITATPAIDAASGTIYVVAMTKEAGAYVHRIHALDITSGVDRVSGGVVIQASVPGSGDGKSSVDFIPKNYKERSGLLLLNGLVYTSWASHCDGGVYHGWVMSYDAVTLRQVGVFNNTANQRSASFWTSGAAPAADAAGNIYLVGGNGGFDAENGGKDLGESYLKVGGDLTPLDYFAPYNFDDLNKRDLDVGSSGLLLLPDEAGSAAHPHLMTSAGKEGRIYLIDRDSLGKFQAGADSQIVQSFTGGIGALFGIPAYYHGTLYFSGVGNPMRAFLISNGQMAVKPSSQTAVTFGFPGGVPSISANGAGAGIVWIAGPGNGLYAYDASDLTKELYNSTKMNGRDSLGAYVKFSTPTIANGKVYVGTQNSLVTYGLLPAASIGAVVDSASFLPKTAPGGLVSVFGVNFTGSTGQATAFPLPGSLAGVSVMVGGKVAPLYYAGAGQINAQVPVDAALGTAAVVVSNGGVAIPPVNVMVQAAAPAIFAVTPVASGSVTVYFTGVGAVDHAVATGAAAPAGVAVNASQMVSATVGGVAATVSFAGLAPGFAGLDQANVVVPAGVALGSVPLVLTVGGVASAPVIVTVR